jgi:hypothetical protein
MKGWSTPVGGDGKGFPDLILARVGNRIFAKVYFWEVKIPPDKVSPEQEAWLDLLGGRVITPSDWDFIVNALK